MTTLSQACSRWGFSILVLLALAGCRPTDTQGSLPTDGPINTVETVGTFDPVESCASWGKRQNAFGARTLTNSGTSGVRIQNIELVNAHNVSLYDSVLVPGEVPPGRTLIDEWPINPADYLAPAYQWDKRIPAIGAEIAANQTYELVLRIGTTRSGRGSFDGVTTTYTYDGDTYQYTDSRSAKLGQKSC